MFKRFSSLRVFAVSLAFTFSTSLRAQDHTIAFSTADPGITRSITNWGLDTGWPNYDNMRRGLIFMGTNNVTVVQVVFEMNAPLTNNDLTTSQKADLANFMSLASMAANATKWYLSCGTGAGVDASYQSGVGTVYPDRWAAAMQAWQRNYNKNFWAVQGFNEPDYGWGQGSQQNLYDIFGYLQATTNFAGSILAGGATLNCDQANSWYNYVANRAGAGTTHCLAGSVSSYVNFLQNVASQGDVPFHPEAHNLCEVIIGANYNLQGVIWWGTAELARGNFLKACQGQRLGYADDWSKWTAGSVYRGTNGAVEAFFGGSERMATTTTYRLFSKDRDVFYDGYGPQRDYTVTVPGGSGYGVNQPGAERVVNISWGSDVPPAINGRYIIVNRNSQKALEVPGGATGNGTLLDQASYTGALFQQWDVNPLPDNFGGDTSYYSIKAAHDGVTADLINWQGYNDGGQIQQWNGGTNVWEQWHFQYAGNGYFKIRSRWSNKVLAVNGASTSSGAQIVQWDDTGTLDQQWRLIPAAVSSYDFVAPNPPAGFKASASALSIQLNSNANGETDLAAYTVLRSTNVAGPYEIIARGLTNTSFTDKSANQPKTYFYKLNAVDKSLNTSANAGPLAATPTCRPALIARYAFDGNTSDSSGNANHLIITSGGPTFVAGKYGSAMDLNGTNQYLMLPANMLASVTNFTIAAWVNWDGGVAWQRIFDFGNDTTQYMFLTSVSGSGTLRFATTTNGAGAEQILETSPLPVGQWRHVAVTRNGNTARLYTNGVLAASNTLTTAPATFNPALNYLGASQYPDPLFNGRLDEFFIYNYALSDMEIGRLANNLPPPPVTPTILSTSLTGNSVSFSWPSNYLGCRLESNSVSLTASGSWFTVAGSAATNDVTLPFDALQTNVFFRLFYP